MSFLDRFARTDQQKRAAEQPRDELGRFATSDKLVLVGESRDMGKGPQSDKILVMAATTTIEPDMFREMADRYSPNTRPRPGAPEDELKHYTSTSEVRKGVLQICRYWRLKCMRSR